MSITANAQRLTKEQNAALAAHDQTVSLAAGAGCGKTFVLTERFLSYLDPRVVSPAAELHELVAITFTDAAAREMRKRIRRRCYELYETAEQPDVRAAWQRLIRTLDAARISTIHSFCGSLLRNHAVEAEIDPRFEVLDAPAAELLRLQTLDDCLREMLQDSDERVLRLATRFELRYLREYLADLLGTHLEPFLNRWRGATVEQMVDNWQEFHTSTVIPVAVAGLASAAAVRNLKQQCQQPGLDTPKFLQRAEEIVAVIDELETGEATAAGSLKQLARVSGVCREKDWDDPEGYKQFKNTCEQVRKLVDRSSLAETLSVEASREAAEVGLQLLQVVDEIAQRYASVKQAANVLEFDDLLSRAHRLLTDPEHHALQQQLHKSTRLLLVDEFQDTDPLQVDIVKALCGENWQQQGLFVVGDHKQSIYRFRGAEPQVSSSLRADLDARSRLSLTTNFRSQPAILEFVNTLFDGSFVQEYEPLSASREQLSPAPAVEFLWSLRDEGDDEPLAENRTPAERARIREAQMIARRLAQLLDSAQPLIPETADDGTESLRPLRLGDVAILMRALSDVPIYEDALRRHGLDYYLAGGHAFYAQQEIFDVLNLLQAIASEADELSLAGALRSPLFGCQDETLYWLVQKSGSLNAGLQADALPPQLSALEQSKVITARSTLQHLRARKDHLLVVQLLSEALELTGYDATLLTEFLGERKLANIYKLVDQARAIDQARPGDLQGFITQLSELVVRDPKEPLATTAGQGDVIQVMTIHHAKGLEFPLVVVPDLERGTQRSDSKPVFDLRLGPLVKAAEKQQMVGFDLHQTIEKVEDSEERKRLLYVACTRAADRLILSSAIEDLDKPKSAWLNLIAEKFDLDTGEVKSVDSSVRGDRLVEVIKKTPPLARKLPKTTRRSSLDRIIEETRELAQQGHGQIPATVAPLTANLTARRRFSFSQLSGQLELEQEERTERLASGSARLDPLRFGTLVHAVMESLGFSTQTDVDQLCRFQAPLCMHQQWREAADEAAELVKGFLATQRARQLAEARYVKREIEFLLPWPEAGDDCYLHGFIDCLYQDGAGQWHVLDYKTNQGTTDDVPQLAEKYAMQMYVYGLACERAFGMPPAECALYFLRPQAEFVSEFSATEASEMKANVTAAIRACRTSATNP